MIDNFVKWLKNDGWRVCEYDNRLKLYELKDFLSKYNFVEEAYLKIITIIKEL